MDCYYKIYQLVFSKILTAEGEGGGDDDNDRIVLEEISGIDQFDKKEDAIATIKVIKEESRWGQYIILETYL